MSSIFPRMVYLYNGADGSVADCVDDGVANREGAPAPRRQILIARLKKTMTIDGKAIKMFALHKAPDKSDPAFDDEFLKSRDGEWILPSKEWQALANKVQGKMQERSAVITESAPAVLETMLASKDPKVVAATRR